METARQMQRAFDGRCAALRTAPHVARVALRVVSCTPHNGTNGTTYRSKIMTEYDEQNRTSVQNKNSARKSDCPQ